MTELCRSFIPLFVYIAVDVAIVESRQTMKDAVPDLRRLLERSLSKLITKLEGKC